MKFSEDMYGKICDKEIVATLLIMLTNAHIAGAELLAIAKEKGYGDEANKRVQKATDEMIKNGNMEKVTEMLIAEAFTLTNEFNK